MKPSKTVALLGVRLTSERLPHKALRLVHGKLVLEHILERFDSSACIDQVVVCTSKELVDDAVADAAIQLGYNCFRGEGDDVLCRFYEAAQQYHATHIVRALGDNLFVCLDHLERQLKLHKAQDVDWSVTEKLPWGMKAEVISFQALEKCYRFAEDTSDSCDLTWYFDQPEYFDILRLEPMNDCVRPEYRLTMDTPEDLSFLRALCEKLYEPVHLASIRNIISVLDAEPKLVAINQNVPDRINDVAYRRRVNTKLMDTPQR